MAPKDKNSIMKKSGVIYRYKCDRVECDKEYIWESSRTFGERFKEHQKAPSPICGLYNITGHNISIDNFTIVGRQDQNLMRTIKEALYIRVNNPSLNRNRQIPTATYLGWGSVKHLRTQDKINWPCGYSIYHYGNNIYYLLVTHPSVAVPSTTWQ